MTPFAPTSKHPDVRRFFPRAFVLGGATVLTVALAAALAWQFTPANGLVARYYATTSWGGDPRLVAVETELSNTAFLRRSNALFPSQPFSGTWQGFLLIPRPGDYTFTLTSDDGSWLYAGGRLIVDNGGAHGMRAVTTTRAFDAGLHPVEVKYFDAGGERAFDLRWAFETQRLGPLPSSVLFPTKATYWIRNVGYGHLLPLLWCGLWMGLPIVWAVRSVSRHLREHRDERLANTALLAVLAVSLGLAIPGIAWGLPYFVSWAPDELLPEDIADGLRQGFSSGWHGAYPPLHYYVLGLLILPFELAAHAGLADVSRGTTLFTMFLLIRSVSVAMSLGTVYLVYLCALEVHQSRLAGILSALLVASMPLFTFYAKLANLEVPYVFWLTLSLFYYIRFVTRARGSDLIGFAIAATLAVCTKDQAYAFYILPVTYILWRRYRSNTPASLPGLLRDRALYAAAGAALLAFIVGQNLVLNFSGFVYHVQRITGPYGSYEQDHDASAVSLLSMIGGTVQQLSWSMGWPSLLVCAAGVVVTARRRFDLTSALGLMVLSYYLFFIAVIRYQFDRFFLGVCVILAIFGGRVLADLLRDGRWAPARRLACAAVVCYGLLYGSFVGVAMATDSRYHVEAWIRANAAPDDLIAYVGRRGYVPRFAYGAVRVLESWNHVSRVRPDILVVNVGYSCRARPGTRRHEFYNRLADPDNGLYRLALSHRSDPRWPVRGPDAVFRAPCEHGATNLSKINPEIRVFTRLPPASP